MLVKIINETLYNIVTFPDINGNVHFIPISLDVDTWYIKTEDVNNCTEPFFNFLKNHDDFEI